ncbi:GNAT family N-acetyltransferase [Labrys monachus]|uniref:N-acetylglutamate synthase-like GNAT family acetyltransferase n=1 Tax=Labrys monachus TaxID=217067 RepID=A0ABU0F7M4_9HYPH|nr:GNAT family N-acetyltransferase [Labrys monachus]MDQ0390436.1 N-acetylglutamate synthase-like GNAT family acetyltransferase [Labrys monachus]
MTYCIVSTHDHSELVPVTGRWRWQGFFKERGIALQDVLRYERERASSREHLPRTFVLLEEREPVGMVTLAENDLEIRPNLNPWLADLYVAEPFRGRGHGLRLVQGLEAKAREKGIDRLWLFTTGAAKLYAKAGWIAVETVTRQGDAMTIMNREF